MSVTLKNCASDVVTALNGQTLGGVALATGNNLFAYPTPYPLSDLVVEVVNPGGGEMAPYIGSTDKALATSPVQVLIHSSPGADGFSQGETLGRAVLGYLQQNVLSGYVTVLSREASPTWLGMDPETQRNSWSINLEAIYDA